MLEDAEHEILAFYALPAAHWRKLRSTNPLERFDREIGRRTDVAGIFPNGKQVVDVPEASAGRRHLTEPLRSYATTFQPAAPSREPTSRQLRPVAHTRVKQATAAPPPIQRSPVSVASPTETSTRSHLTSS